MRINTHPLNSQILFLIIISAALALGGCSATPTALSKKMVIGEIKGDAAPLLKTANALWDQRGDAKKALDAIKAWEEAMELNPTLAEIPLKLTYAYYFMAHVHDRWIENKSQATAKMEAWYLKGMKMGERAIFLQNPDFKKQIEAQKDWAEAVKTVKKEGIPSLYWYATNLGKWSLIQGITTTLGNKNRIKSTMEQVLKLDESFYHGAPHRYFGVYEAKVPGGSIEASGKSFDNAIKLSPDYLDTHVLKAEYFAAKTQNEELFISLLETVKKADPKKIPELEVENRNAQRIAAQLLENIENFF
jgi:tetratricopeptide (TPR) repeat protein